MVKDWLGLDKVDKKINDSLKFELFPQPKQRKGDRNRKAKAPTHTQKNKPILTAHQKSEGMKFLKETGSAFSGMIKNIKNRKIRKLEKETLKNIDKAEALAHKIKTIQENNDALTDIERYDKELELLEKQAREDKARREEPKKDIQHTNLCLEYNNAQINENYKKCICEDS